MMIATLVLSCGAKQDPLGLQCDDLEFDPLVYQDVESIVVEQCTSCHHSAAEDRRNAPSIVDFDNFDYVLPYAERMRARVLSRGMPPVSAIDDLALPTFDNRARCRLAAWVTQGAQE
jgi:uncharacterized membrane protein